MDYQESLEYLQQLQTFGMKLGLERMKYMMYLMGNPQDSYKTIHVTGTNGKGSVTAMLASCLRAAGIHTGMYISPHLSSYTERISIDGQAVSEKQLADALSAVRDICEFMTGEGKEHPTQFEVLTAAAFYLFQKAGVEYAVIEVGLGGSLDSTNVITPVLSVITNVTMEHADKCGGTLEGIAETKAGIIKAGVPVVTGAEGKPLEIIQAKAAELGCMCYVMGRDFLAEAQRPLGQLSIPPNLGSVYNQQDRNLTDMQIEALSRMKLDCQECAPNQQLITFTGKHPLFADLSFKLSLLGKYQAFNAGLAAAAFMVLAAEDLRFTRQALKRGMGKTVWQGRFELLHCQGQRVLADGAHNPAGIVALRASLDETFPYEQRIFVLGVLKDKDYRTMLPNLLREQDAIVLTTPLSERAAKPAELLSLIPCREKEAVDNPAQALDRGLEIAKDKGKDSLLICCGSLYLIGYLRELVLEKSKNPAQA